MAEVLFDSDSTTLLFQLIQEASQFKKKNNYRLCSPCLPAPVDITQNMETLSELCTSAEFPMNVFCLLYNTPLRDEAQLVFEDPVTNHSLQVGSNHTLRLCCNGTTKYVLDARDPDAFGRVKFFFTGY